MVYTLYIRSIKSTQQDNVIVSICLIIIIHVSRTAGANSSPKKDVQHNYQIQVAGPIFSFINGFSQIVPFQFIGSVDDSTGFKKHRAKYSENADNDLRRNLLNTRFQEYHLALIQLVFPYRLFPPSFLGLDIVLRE